MDAPMRDVDRVDNDEESAKISTTDTRKQEPNVPTLNTPLFEVIDPAILAIHRSDKQLPNFKKSNTLMVPEALLEFTPRIDNVDPMAIKLATELATSLFCFVPVSPRRRTEIVLPTFRKPRTVNLLFALAHDLSDMLLTIL
jgi:hypothetical protein